MSGGREQGANTCVCWPHQTPFRSPMNEYLWAGGKVYWAAVRVGSTRLKRYKQDEKRARNRVLYVKQRPTVQGTTAVHTYKMQGRNGRADKKEKNKKQKTGRKKNTREKKRNIRDDASWARRGGRRPPLSSKRDTSSIVVP